MEVLSSELVLNLRRESLNGRQYLVVPVTLIVPGVLNGSQGPLLYPQEEVAKNVEAWNGIPLLIDHPRGSVPARGNPSIVVAQGVGFLKNVSVNGKLSGEAWHDVEALRRISPKTFSAIEGGQRVEVSTGLGTENESISGEHDGVPYNAIARNYQPDHLAILPDSVGACSVEDGCGLNVNTTTLNKEFDMDKAELVTNIITNGCCWDESDRDVLMGFSDEKLKALHDDMAQNKEAGEQKQVAELALNSAGFTQNDKGAWVAPQKKEEPPKSGESVQNALSDQDRELLDWAKSQRQSLRDTATEKVMKNEGNKLTKEQLDAMPLDTVQNLAASLPSDEPEGTVVNHLGMSIGATTLADNEKIEPMLPIEVIAAGGKLPN